MTAIIYCVLLTLAAIGMLASTLDAWGAWPGRSSAPHVAESNPMLPGGAGPPTRS